MKAKQQRIQQILSETILALCNNGLEFECEMEVDGLLGITLDKKDVFLVKISEVVQGVRTIANANSENSKDNAAHILSSRYMEESSDSSASITVPAKRLQACAPLGLNRSPKRKKQEEEEHVEDDDDMSPQDLSQQRVTHSPSVKKEAMRSYSATNSPNSSHHHHHQLQQHHHQQQQQQQHHRDSSPAATVVISPSPTGSIEATAGSSSSQWKDMETMENAANITQPDDDEAVTSDDPSVDHVTSNLAKQNMTSPVKATTSVAVDREQRMEEDEEEVEGMEGGEAMQEPQQEEEEEGLLPVKEKICMVCQSKDAKLVRVRNELIDYHRTREYYSVTEDCIPRPGNIPPTVAEYYKMQEFVGGSGIYVYPDRYRELMAELRSKLKPGTKPPSAWIASELIDIFYNDKDFKPPAIEAVDQCVINAIITLALKEGTGNKNTVVMAVESKTKQIRAKQQPRPVGMPFPVPVMLPPPPPRMPAPSKPSPQPHPQPHPQAAASALTGAAIRTGVPPQHTPAAATPGPNSPPSSRGSSVGGTPRRSIGSVDPRAALMMGGASVGDRQQQQQQQQQGAFQAAVAAARNMHERNIWGEDSARGGAETRHTLGENLALLRAQQQQAENAVVFRRNEIGGGLRASDIGGGIRGPAIAGGTRGPDIGGAIRGPDIGGAIRGPDIGGAIRGPDIAGGGLRGNDLGYSGRSMDSFSSIGRDSFGDRATAVSAANRNVANFLGLGGSSTRPGTSLGPVGTRRGYTESTDRYWKC